MTAKLLGRHGKCYAGIPLTDRECQVLTLIANGEPNKCIAHAMQIKLCTVNSHLAVIYAKLSATSRSNAVAIALRTGQIE